MAAAEPHRFVMVARRAEIAALASRHGTRWCLYYFRHCLPTRMLEAYVDALTVSALLGHADGTTQAEVYIHLAKKEEHPAGRWRPATWRGVLRSRRGCRKA